MNKKTRRQYLQEEQLAYARVYPDDLNIQRLPSGEWLISAVFDGYRHALTYMGYNKTEAVRLYLDRYNKKGI